jgi:hypothetical protein
MCINAFRGVSHVDVDAALAEFWSRHDRLVEPVPLDASVDAFGIYEQRNGWTVVSWTIGWEWKLRRQAQVHVSEALGCAGILVFVYDGDDWGYELFDRGAAVDWFVTVSDEHFAASYLLVLRPWPGQAGVEVTGGSLSSRLPTRTVGVALIWRASAVHRSGEWLKRGLPSSKKRCPPR